MNGQAESAAHTVTPPAGAACGACCTQVHNLSVALHGRTVLEHVDLHVHCGEIVTIIGPNGAGKTTLLRALVNEIPYRGSFAFRATRGGGSVARAVIGYVPQKLEIDRGMPLTVTDLFAAAMSRRPVFLGVSRRVRQAVQRNLEMVDAGHLAARRLGRLSGGELQRVMLALALAPEPDILLLDEPLASVDHAGVAAFYRYVEALRAQRDLAIIMVSHDLADAARISNRMIFLNRTILREGPPAEVLADPLVRATFGAAVWPGEAPV